MELGLAMLVSLLVTVRSANGDALVLAEMHVRVQGWRQFGLDHLLHIVGEVVHSESTLVQRILVVLTKFYPFKTRESVNVNRMEWVTHF